MTYFQSLSAAGFAATAVSFGPGRIGFGLFASDFRLAFSLSTQTIGVISSLGFFGFFLALLVAQAMLSRRGPSVPVLSGLGCAVLGMSLVATAQSATWLALGVFLASSSAGFAWTPFNDAVHRKIRDVDRPEALSEISTGTGVGVAVAGFAAIAIAMTGLSWRLGWAIFAAASAVAFALNWWALRPVEKAPNENPARAWRRLINPAALPLYLIGLTYGAVSAIYISFAPDHSVSQGGLPGLPASAAPGLVFVAYGLCGLAGLFTARVREAIGLCWLLRAMMLSGASSLALAALFPASWAGLPISAGLQGVQVMMTSAIVALWSERLFPAMPSLGFTGALLAMAAGSVFGPVLAGAAASAFGPEAMFLGAAVLPLAVALGLRDGHAQDRPAATA